MLSIIVPTYNECDTLSKLIEAIQVLLKDVDHEIVVVDDNSGDGTGELAEALRDVHGNIKVVHRPRKMGSASAFVSGLKVATGDVIGTLNADFQHPPEYLPTMLKRIGEVDIVIASRYVSEGSVEGWSFWRRIISRGAGILARIFLPKVRSVKDAMSGFFILKRKVIENVQLSPIGFKILLEILVKGSYVKTIELPYTFKNRKAGKSKFTFKDVFIYLSHLLHLMKASGELKRIFRFCTVGAVGVGINEGLLWLLTEKLGLYYVTSSIFGIGSATLSNFIWNELWTFKDLRKRGAINIVTRALRFNAVRLTGLSINLMILFLLTEFLGIHYLISNFIAVIIATFWNYITSLNLVWRESKR